MSFNLNNGIPESDLPVKSPSGASMLRYVENGKSYSGALIDVTGPIDDRINVLEVSQGDGVPGVANYADIAALFPSPTAGQQVDVLTDPDPAKVGRWGYIGGVWVKSADRVTGLEGRVASVESKVGVEGFLTTNSDSAINFDHTSGLLKIAGSAVRMFYDRTSLLLPAQEIPIPTTSAGTTRRIEVDRTTGLVTFNSATSTPVNSVIVGDYTPTGRIVSGMPRHLVNSLPVVPPALAMAIPSSAASVTFNVGTMRLVITANQLRISTASFTTVMPATDIAIPASGNHVLRYDRDANSVEFAAASANPDPRKIVFAQVRVSGGTVDVHGIPVYTITGGPAPLPIYEGQLVASGPAFVNFDWTGRFLRINGATSGATSVRLLYGRRNNQRVLTQDIPIPDVAGWHRIVVDVATLTVSIVSVSSDIVPANSVIVGLVNPRAREVHGIPSYQSNGASPGGGTLDALEWLPVDGPTEPRFTVPALLPDFKAFGGADTNTDHNSVYALYDALVSAYPDYVTRSTLGLDDAGNTIYRYDFKPPADNGSGTAGRLAKMILISGTHGYERAGIYCLYAALHQVCSRWADDDLLDTLRWNCHFIVVPCLVPYGFDTVGRLNPNGVDIARNFTAEWSAAQANPGSGPLSEKESQYLDGIMAANRDAIYCGSFHNFLDSQAGDPNFIWNASATMFGIRLAQRLVSKMSRKWKPTCPWLPQNNTSVFGYSDLGAPPGSEGKQSTLTYGIQGGTFEISRALHTAPDASSYSQYVNTLGTETIVNWLLMNLEQGTQLYNGRGS